jgi:hypothetical protein
MPHTERYWYVDGPLPTARARLKSIQLLSMVVARPVAIYR